MAYQLYGTEQGQFSIDWDTCCQIIRSYHRSAAQLKYAIEQKESQRGLNPLSWGLPELTYIEVDWDKVRKDTETNTLEDAWRLAAFATFDNHGVDDLVERLQEMQKETRRATAEFNRRQRDASKSSMESMKTSVDGYQSAIDLLKLTRDLSGSILIGAATVATGGATSAALVGGGLGTIIKTTAKYQDTGSVGVAAVEAAQNIIVCVIPAARGAKLKGSEEVMKYVLAAVLDTDKALLEGRELSTAVIEGAVAGLVGKAGEKSKGAIKAILDRTAVPLTATVLNMPTKVASDYLVGVVKKVAEDRTKKSVQGMVKSSGQTRHEVARSRVDENSWDSVMTFADKDQLLLKFAVIDMSKGVGHSWW